VRLRGALLAVALLAGCGRGDDQAAPNEAAGNVTLVNKSAPPPPARPAGPPSATLSGIGAVKVGETIAQAKAGGAPIARIEAPMPGSTCTYARVPGLEDVDMMLDGERIVRVDVANPGVPTLGGVRVGMGEDEVLKRLPGQVAVEAHPYTGPVGHYLIVHAPGAKRGLILETDGTAVISYRVGEWDAVQLVEGCS
jgi:hypothetical protein